MNAKRYLLVVGVVVGILGVAQPAVANVPEGGDTRPCVTEREDNLIGGLHQTRADVRRIVDTPGVVVSDHAFDGWNADAGVLPKDEYGAPANRREIRRYPMCPGMVHRYGTHYVFVEYLLARDSNATIRVEQSRWR
jgi:hypothetical protein